MGAQPGFPQCLYLFARFPLFFPRRFPEIVRARTARQERFIPAGVSIGSRRFPRGTLNPLPAVAHRRRSNVSALVIARYASIYMRAIREEIGRRRRAEFPQRKRACHRAARPRNFCANFLPCAVYSPFLSVATSVLNFHSILRSRLLHEAGYSQLPRVSRTIRSTFNCQSSRSQLKYKQFSFERATLLPSLLHIFVVALLRSLSFLFHRPFK